uniref:Uncharacterized protein n=1 Tax=Ascaris lumbricoides TaxID=6252 RepID=A0A0M3IXK7_ASCLU
MIFSEYSHELDALVLDHMHNHFWALMRMYFLFVLIYTLLHFYCRLFGV